MYRARNLKTRKNTTLLVKKGEGRQFIIFDTETTGTKADKDYVVEFSAIRCEIRNGAVKELESLDIFIKPPFPVPQGAIDVHHITNEFLADKPSETEVFPIIKDFFGPNPIVMGHNVDFDIDMMNAMYLRQNQVFAPQVALDTLEMARDLLTAEEVSDYKLETLVTYFGLNTGITFHSSIDDVRATLRLFTVLYDEYEKLPPIEPLKRLYVNRISYWKGYCKEQAGIWLETSAGKMHYSTLLKAWFSSTIPLDRVDIDYLEKELLEKLELDSLKTFGKLTEKKFNAIKTELRAKGVYL